MSMVTIDSFYGMDFKCILADPPWPQKLMGKFKNHGAARQLPYSTMTIEEIKSMLVGKAAADDAHLWLWTTNSFLKEGFDVMKAWGFRYLAPIHWIKPSGIGAWFVHRTQTLLFGYKKSCRFPMARMKPNIFHASNPARHSEKPEESYQLIESISLCPRLELFARRKRENWTTWGNEV